MHWFMPAQAGACCRACRCDAVPFCELRHDGNRGACLDSRQPAVDALVRNDPPISSGQKVKSAAGRETDITTETRNVADHRYRHKPHRFRVTGGDASRPRSRQRRGRSLVTELLSAQLAITGLIGACALAGLAWISDSVVTGSLTRWAAQWRSQLDELGSPFQTADGVALPPGAAAFVERYPEIVRVTWYRPDGDVIATVGERLPALPEAIPEQVPEQVPGQALRQLAEQDPEEVPREAGRLAPLAPDLVAELEELLGDDQPYLLVPQAGAGELFRFSGPVWTVVRADESASEAVSDRAAAGADGSAGYDPGGGPRAADAGGGDAGSGEPAAGVAGAGAEGSATEAAAATPALPAATAQSPATAAEPAAARAEAATAEPPSATAEAATAAPEPVPVLLGFVAVDLDYSAYLAPFSRQLAIGSLLLFLVLVLSWAGGRALLKRALLPLSKLQLPLAELAEGRRRIVLPQSPHSEIRNIVRALDQTIDALDKREDHLLHLATHDPLTGLLNRKEFIEELKSEVEACGEQGYSSALLFMDLDQFKHVNDIGGHIVGDNMIRAAGRQLRHSVRENDVVGRFGGDEFVALIRDVTRAEAGSVANNVLETMRRVTHVADEEAFHMQCSIGVAAIRSNRYSAQEVLAHADNACRTAKARGRNRVEIYNISSRQREQMEKDVHWMREIRQALESDAFELHYQPLLHVPTRTVSHYEALVRLRTRRGLIGPDRFLPAAVRFGLMADIDRWVLARGIRVLGESTGDSGPARLSVNLTAHAFESADLVSFVRGLLSEAGVDGDRLVIEVTEQLAVRFAANTDRQFAALRDLGCRFAIDDFGAGYSSFSYLKRLPVDYLKIDGSFVRTLARDKVDRAMVRMIAEVARAADLTTVAEFVQTPAIFERLVEYGIDYAQGNYIGAAAPEFRGCRRARIVAGV